jgi:hypothetical protein
MPSATADAHHATRPRPFFSSKPLSRLLEVTGTRAPKAPEAGAGTRGRRRRWSVTAAQRRTLCHQRDLPFGRGGGVLLHCPVIRPMPRHADAHRIERNDAAGDGSAALPANSRLWSGKIFFPFFLIWGFSCSGDLGWLGFALF